MVKNDLIKQVAEKSGLSADDCGTFVNAFLETVLDTVKSGEEVKLPGFGTFKLSCSSERNGINPATGEKIVIPASKKLAFSAGKNAKNLP